MILIDAKIAIKSLRSTKLRTALTMLGIVIGVASVTMVLSLGEGAKQKVREQVSFLGPDLLTVRPGKVTLDNKGNIVDYNFLAALGSSTISERDLATIQQEPGVVHAAPIMAITGGISAEAGGRSVEGTSIIATDTELDDVMDFTLRSGEFVNDATNRETVVLGFDLANELLGSDQAIGQRVTLRGQDFTVIGILGPYGVRTTFNNLFDFNRTAFIPFDAGKAFNQGIPQMQQINVRVTKDNTRQVADSLRQQILKNHNDEEDFSILRPEQTIQVADNLLQIVTVLTTALASISLVVGGIGIMNIMLVSVTERTREIGIRKAVGATNAQILRQFLIEALMMSLVGGFVGVGVAYGAAFAVGSFMEFMPVITWQTLATAVGIATIVGVLFGITPAIKAARKDPIEALRFFQ
jgi:ABC-type antimicrobial peptide transport system permease subunit